LLSDDEKSVECMENVKHKIQNFIESIWYQPKGLAAYLLSPFSYVFIFIASIRKQLYKGNIIKSNAFNVPIIIVGNITVGGSGKTPLVIALANFFKSSGFNVGIVSRGYGAAFDGAKLLDDNSKAPEVGDEPLLIFQKAQVPVAVSKNRPLAVEKLIKEKKCNLIISDDGLQHYALQRDIEIAVIDGSRQLGNGFCLPAGPLREPASRLNSVDYIIENNSTKPASTKYIQMRILPDCFINLATNEKAALESFKGKTVHAYTGLGNPSKFFALLKSLGIEVKEHAFPDHYLFKEKDFLLDNQVIIMMTEKDAVKCKLFANEQFWCLPISAEIDGNFCSNLLQKVNVKFKELNS
jgi:tetraacyldisaccharide 4'-kinase